MENQESTQDRDLLKTLREYRELQLKAEIASLRLEIARNNVVIVENIKRIASLDEMTPEELLIEFKDL